MSDPMRIRAQAQGNGAVVRVLMSHEMETGQRKDADGKVIPAWHITEVTAALNGKTVMTAQWGTAIAKLSRSKPPGSRTPAREASMPEAGSDSCHATRHRRGLELGARACTRRDLVGTRGDVTPVLCDFAVLRKAPRGLDRGVRVEHERDLLGRCGDVAHVLCGFAPSRLCGSPLGALALSTRARIEHRALCGSSTGCT